MTRILVVDGEPFLGRALTEYGADVDEARDASQALELVGGEEYRLVLLNVPVSGSDGPELLKRMLVIRPEQQVVVLSGLADAETKTRCLDLGAADYLTKPIVLPDLLARIRRSLTSAVEQGVLRAGPVTLDLHRHAVSVGAETIALTGREFRLLHHLMLQRDEVCTRVELLSEVWGYSFDPGTNVVDVYVRRLRAKVGANRIQTIRNVGYAFQSFLAAPSTQAMNG